MRRSELRVPALETHEARFGQRHATGTWATGWRRVAQTGMLRVRESALGSGDGSEPVEVVNAPGGVTVLVLSGELDIARTPQLRVAINEVLRARPQALVIDLCAVTFADSTVLALLLNAQRRATHQGIPLRLACDVASTLQILAFTRLDREFQIHASRRDAVRSALVRSGREGRA